jgi:hypothetical protein
MIDEARDAVAALGEWLNHTLGCALRTTHHKDGCDCGLDNAIRSVLSPARVEGAKYPAIWLEGFKGDWTVKVEVDGKWVEVIREFYGDGGHVSHIVESRGIDAALDAARVEGGEDVQPIQEGRCGHSSYWTTHYGNCMACRAEKAEAKLAACREALRAAEAAIGDACHATAIYGDQPPQMYLDALRTVQVALAKP